MKKIAVIVRNLPLNTRRNAEALRMSVGLTLREDKVTVIFMDDGVYSATRTKPELINLKPLSKEFEALSMLKCPMLADKISMKKRGISTLTANVRAIEREELVKTITESDIVIPF
ncbi:MAG: DsrE family protein [Candidatus Methanoperedens sp.]|nr:DsrE family protein [Candidatus Methanoperedens sp.]MCZ7404439.1 DsrE family protein [Candidatus Methanoperedens sp.]